MTTNIILWIAIGICLIILGTIPSYATEDLYSGMLADQYKANKITTCK